MLDQAKEMQISLGEIALIKDDEKNMGKYNIGIDDKLYRGKEDMTRAVGLRIAKSYIENPIQYMHPL